MNFYTRQKVLQFEDFVFLSENLESYGLVLESLNSAKKLYLKTQKIDDATFSQLVNIDPSSTKKYLEKLCKFYLETQDLSKFEELIIIYDRLVQKNLTSSKDINKFKNFQEFESEVESHKDTKSNTELREFIKKSDIDIILDDERFLVLRPKSENASCIYGAGTKWCISAKTKNYWSQYYDNNLVTFYFVIQKNLSDQDPMYKIAVSVYPDGENIESFDAKDSKINFKKVLNLGLKTDIFQVDVSKERMMKQYIKGTYTINADGSIDVQGNVYLSDKELTELPLTFGKVSGDFSCSYNQLTSLEGAPKEVGGDFNCSDNKAKFTKEDVRKVSKVKGNIIV